MEDDGHLQADNAKHTRFDGKNCAETIRKSNYYDKMVMEFKRLQDIANSDEKYIITTINQEREAFLDIIGNDIERHDVFVLSIKIFSKICKPSVDQLKFKLILDMCNTQFIESLLKYLLDLPYAEIKSNNSLYWNNQEEFWSNLVTFSDYIITSSPSTAFMKYRSLVEATKSCLNSLNEQNAFAGADKYITKLDELRMKLSTISNKYAAAMIRKDGSEDIHDVQPPDNFRWLNIVPMSLDLSQHTPFVRPNIIKGAYQDIEHYLDVQFRLLREDCFGPLREGVLQFKKDPQRRSYENIRVFHNVKFTQPYITQGKVGIEVQIELSHKKNKNFAKTNWVFNKRFIFGSLVLFTKDNCRSFIAATVMDRNTHLLAQGKIPVTLVDERFDESLYNPNDSYTMIESEIFFEPYYHVMKAMQDPLFSQKLPMQQYIVKVQLEHNPPAYLHPDQKFVFKVLLNTNRGRQQINFQQGIYDDDDDDYHVHDDYYDDDDYHGHDDNYDDDDYPVHDDYDDYQVQDDYDDYEVQDDYDDYQVHDDYDHVYEDYHDDDHFHDEYDDDDHFNADYDDQFHDDYDDDDHFNDDYDDHFNGDYDDNDDHFNDDYDDHSHDDYDDYNDYDHFQDDDDDHFNEDYDDHFHDDYDDDDHFKEDYDDHFNDDYDDHFNDDYDDHFNDDYDDHFNGDYDDNYDHFNDDYDDHFHDDYDDNDDYDHFQDDYDDQFNDDYDDHFYEDNDNYDDHFHIYYDDYDDADHFHDNYDDHYNVYDDYDDDDHFHDNYDYVDDYHVQDDFDDDDHDDFDDNYHVHYDYDDDYHVNDDDDYDDDAVKFRTTVDKYDVLRPDTWPSKEEFSFDESQYEAYKHALTHEFAVIQGPPGTGKTFIGLKITETLLDNLKDINGCLILVISYTNDALDQFLEGILRHTRSVVRVGGQSKHKDLKGLNLNKLRSKRHRRSATHNFYKKQKNNLKMTTNELRNGLILLDILNNGVLSYDCIKDSAPGLQLLGDYYSNFNDPLFNWLFENTSEFVTDFEDCLSKHQDDNDNMEGVKKKTDRRKQKLLVGYDDYDSEILDEIFKSEELKTSFSLKIAEKTLKQLITDYKNKPLNDVQLRHLMTEIEDLNSRIMMYKSMSEVKWRRVDIRIDNQTNFRNIPTEDRWALYFGWVEPKIEEIKNNVAVLQRSLELKITTLEESRMLLDLEVLKRTRVVGMTTCGAARRRKLINALDAPIVIIEEAAEVLEQHIITSLTKNSQHVILIGDHQQLRPSASYIKLARQFNLEVSLFERMVCNGVHSRRLGVQHRMRPEIAALVSPHIYPDLHNHASVLTKPNVTGLDKNLFFFTHDYKEEETTNWNKSKANHKEAELTLALANYIMQQGYKAEDVTILTTYSEQMYYLRKKRANYFQLKNVIITSVDNYQGEESKIILLSLVRNNEKGEIGFLGTENRICVALSRAQEGFYIFGNIDILRNKSSLWQKIATTLENSESLGSSLLLKCERHLNYKTVINTVEDFLKVPEGGCNQQCNFEMKCGHKCILFCHGYDRPHETEWTKCELPCERPVCDLKHSCPLKCGQKCEPCKVLIKKTLPCKHKMDLYCHLDPEDKSIKCLTEVPCTLPACGHKGTKMCYEQIEKVHCKEQCV